MRIDQDPRTGREGKSDVELEFMRLTLRPALQHRECGSINRIRSIDRYEEPELETETIVPGSMKEIQELSDEAWHEFTATFPEGIDYVAEASLRGLMVGRIRRALAKGEVDKEALRKAALHDL